MFRGRATKELPRVKCPQAMEIGITCKGDCSITADEPSRMLEFDIEIKTETTEWWKLTEASIAFPSAEKELLFQPLPHLGDEDWNLITPGGALDFQWSKESSAFWNHDAVVVVNAEAENTIGLRCSVDATYPKR